MSRGSVSYFLIGKFNSPTNTNSQKSIKCCNFMFTFYVKQIFYITDRYLSTCEVKNLIFTYFLITHWFMYKYYHCTGKIVEFRDN